MSSQVHHVRWDLHILAHVRRLMKPCSKIDCTKVLRELGGERKVTGWNSFKICPQHCYTVSRTLWSGISCTRHDTLSVFLVFSRFLWSGAQLCDIRNILFNNRTSPNLHPIKGQLQSQFLILQFDCFFMTKADFRTQKLLLHTPFWPDASFLKTALTFAKRIRNTCTCVIICLPEQSLQVPVEFSNLSSQPSLTFISQVFKHAQRKSPEQHSKRPYF